MSNESIILRFDHKLEMIEQEAKAAHCMHICLISGGFKGNCKRYCEHFQKRTPFEIKS